MLTFFSFLCLLSFYLLSLSLLFFPPSHSILFPLLLHPSSPPPIFFPSPFLSSFPSCSPSLLFFLCLFLFLSFTFSPPFLALLTLLLLPRISLKAGKISTHKGDRGNAQTKALANLLRSGGHNGFSQRMVLGSAKIFFFRLLKSKDNK